MSLLFLLTRMFMDKKGESIILHHNEVVKNMRRSFFGVWNLHGFKMELIKTIADCFNTIIIINIFMAMFGILYLITNKSKNLSHYCTLIFTVIELPFSSWVFLQLYLKWKEKNNKCTWTIMYMIIEYFSYWKGHRMIFSFLEIDWIYEPLCNLSYTERYHPQIRRVIYCTASGILRSIFVLLLECLEEWLFTLENPKTTSNTTAINKYTQYTLSCWKTLHTNNIAPLRLHGWLRSTDSHW